MAINYDKEWHEETLAKLLPLIEKIARVRGLYGIAYALKGDDNPSWSAGRLADALRVLHGDEVVAELSAMPYELLRKELKKYLNEVPE